MTIELAITDETPEAANEPLKVEVNAEALRQLLQALVGPGHHIRELQFTRGLPGSANPIDTLVAEYNAWAAKAAA